MNQIEDYAAVFDGIEPFSGTVPGGTWSISSVS